MITGSRFAALVPDESGGLGDYVPRHLKETPLSPELQEALDRAFAPEPEDWSPARAVDAEVVEPEPEAEALEANVTVPVPEPVPHEPQPEFTPVPQLAPQPEFAAREFTPQQEFVVAVPTPASPMSPTFPDPAAYAARRVAGAVAPAPAPAPMGRFFRRKVDPSRLLVGPT